MLYSSLALLGGFLLDLLIGDPHGWPHMVRLFGLTVRYLEARLYGMCSKRLAGTLLVIIMMLMSTGIPALLLLAAWRLSFWAYLIAEGFLCWQALAVRSLRDESLPVYRALAEGDLPKARRALSMIVGRDTEKLDEPGVIRATVETVAENTSDGVAAPLFYLVIGGGALGCLYKAVNTMDSMIGYKNERYADFGYAAARADDVLNYLPARLCALCMIAASRLCGLDAVEAYRVWRRDRRRHASPNAAQTEAVMAGALHVRLAGDNYYGGRLVRKPTIGDNLQPIRAGDILWAHRLLYATSLLSFIIAMLLRGIAYAAL